MRQRWRKTYRNYSRFNPDNERQYYQFGAVPYTGKKKFRGFTDENPQWTGKDPYVDYMKKRHEEFVEVTERQELEQWMSNVYDNYVNTGYGDFLIENLDRFEKGAYEFVKERGQKRREEQRRRNLSIARNSKAKSPDKRILKPIGFNFSGEKSSSAEVGFYYGDKRKVGEGEAVHLGNYVSEQVKPSFDGKEFTFGTLGNVVN